MGRTCLCGGRPGCILSKLFFFETNEINSIAGDKNTTTSATSGLTRTLSKLNNKLI